MSGSIVDLFYDENHAKCRWQWGNETFYDDQNRLIEFDTSLEALEWIDKEHPELTKRVKQGAQLTMGMTEKKGASLDKKGDDVNKDGTRQG